MFEEIFAPFKLVVSDLEGLVQISAASLRTLASAFVTSETFARSVNASGTDECRRHTHDISETAFISFHGSDGKNFACGKLLAIQL